MVSRLSITFIASISFFIHIGWAQALPTDKLCADQKDLACLKKNFTKLYRTNYHLFFSILIKAEKKLCKSTSPRETIEFLEVGPKILGNAEVGEYFSEIIEELVFYRMPCLLNNMKKIDDESKNRIFEVFKFPVHSSAKRIMDILKVYEDIERFESLNLNSPDDW